MSPMEAFKMSIMVSYWISMSLSFLLTASRSSCLSRNRIKRKRWAMRSVCNPAGFLPSYSCWSDVKIMEAIIAFYSRSVQRRSSKGFILIVWDFICHSPLQGKCVNLRVWGALMQLIRIRFGSLWSTPCTFLHSTIQSSTSTSVKAQPSCTGSSLPSTYHFLNNQTKKNTLSATTAALRIYHPLIQSKSLSAVNSSSFLWTDVTAWCYSLLYNSYLSFYFSPTSCFELCLSAFPFLLQTKCVPCRLRVLDVETQKKKTTSTPAPWGRGAL